ncbi:hypothetical protein [Tetragenococcus halophilus]|uniref:hypothetical protein n=1 Tax=Tetragenococcus halophilus TaxID=51669 RepID=UPI0030E7AC48
MNNIVFVSLYLSFIAFLVFNFITMKKESDIYKKLNTELKKENNLLWKAVEAFKEERGENQE